MRTILSTFMIVIVLAFAAFGSFSLVFANVKVTNAENFFESACSEMENCYYDEDVIEKCIAKADEEGYKLSVVDESYDLYGEKVPSLYVKMTYPFSIPLFNVSKDIEINGYIN